MSDSIAPHSSIQKIKSVQPAKKPICAGTSREIESRIKNLGGIQQLWTRWDLQIRSCQMGHFDKTEQRFKGGLPEPILCVRTRPLVGEKGTRHSMIPRLTRRSPKNLENWAMLVLIMNS